MFLEFRKLPGLIALPVLALYLAGCAQMGPDLVKDGRNDYNIILQQTEAEEAILNLVRVRYGDRPLFLDVSNVSTSFTWTQGSCVQCTLYFVSHGVEVPVRDSDRGHATMTASRLTGHLSLATWSISGPGTQNRTWTPYAWLFSTGVHDSISMTWMRTPITRCSCWSSWRHF